MKRMLMVLLAGVCAGGVMAQDGADDPMAEMMQAYIEAGKPNENHRKLDALVGTWKTKSTMWMDPTSEPMQTEGKAKKAWDLDGRFIREEMSGEGPTGAYTGRGYLGYDNATDEYQGVWMSSMSTGMLPYTGSVSEDGKVFTFYGQEPEPMSGAVLDFKFTVTIDSADQHTLTFWYLMPDEANAMKAFEIVHTRAE